MTDIYENCPVLEDERFLLRLVKEEDAIELLRTYGDRNALPFFNSDNCNGDNFYYPTRERMLEAVKYWISSYKKGWFTRFSIIDKAVSKLIGTAELFVRESDDAFNGDGVLRIDVRNDYERETVLYDILSFIVPRAFDMLGCGEIITKAPIYAVERIKALERYGFEKSEHLMIGTHDRIPYNGYWTVKKPQGYIIKKLSPELADDYFDFFDNRAFSDGSPYYPCYCGAFNLSKERIQDEIFGKAKEYGGGVEGLKRALRESAERMVENGEIQGYLAYDKETAIGWCNANDRLNYSRVGEFDVTDIPDDDIFVCCHGKGEIKSVVCFEIAPEYRGRGIATLLLERVCADALADGYEFVEAYPENRAEFSKLAFTGPARLYKKAGFFVADEKENTLIMRKKLK